MKTHIKSKTKNRVGATKFVRCIPLMTIILLLNAYAQASPSVTNLVEALDSGGIEELCREIKKLPAEDVLHIYSSNACVLAENNIEENTYNRFFGKKLLNEIKVQSECFPEFSYEQLESSIQNLYIIEQYLGRGNSVGNLVLQHSIYGVIVDQVLFRRVNGKISAMQAKALLRFSERNLIKPDCWLSIIMSEYTGSFVESFEFSSKDNKMRGEEIYDYFGNNSPIGIGGYSPLSYDVETVFDKQNPLFTITDMTLTYQAYVTLVVLDNLSSDAANIARTKEEISTLLDNAEETVLKELKYRYGDGIVRKDVMLSAIRRASGGGHLVRFHQ